MEQELAMMATLEIEADARRAKEVEGIIDRIGSSVNLDEIDEKYTNKKGLKKKKKKTKSNRLEKKVQELTKQFSEKGAEIGRAKVENIFQDLDWWQPSHGSIPPEELTSGEKIASQIASSEAAEELFTKLNPFRAEPDVDSGLDDTRRDGLSPPLRRLAQWDTQTPGERLAYKILEKLPARQDVMQQVVQSLHETGKALGRG